METVKHKRVYVARTKLGRGLFAKTDIKKGETVFIIKGNLVKDSYNDDYQTIPNSLTISEGVWLDPFEHNPWRFINHSCAPNVGLKGKVTVVTLCDIRGGELTIDYSITEDDPNWKMKCSCGAKECRKIIKSIRFLPRELYEKYEPYIPGFLRKSYEQYHR